MPIGHHGLLQTHFYNNVFTLGVGFLLFSQLFQFGLNVSLRSPSSQNGSGSSERDGKLFPFPFVAVSFPSDLCIADHEGNYGSCYTKKYCSKLGGTEMGLTCAQGYGVCCKVDATCSGTSGHPVTIKTNMTHIKMTGRSSPQQCKYNIPRRKNVCQLRLDFRRFSISDGDPNGDCTGDTVTFTGADNLVEPLTLCGHSDGNHLYLHYGDADTVSMNVDLMEAASSIDVQVTMVKCDSPNRAPDGCTQFYTTMRGDVKSFNYMGQQLNNERYSVCIKNFPGSEKIRWTKCNPTAMDFFVSGNATNSTAQNGDSCKEKDHVAILGTPGGKFCGGDFNPVESNAKPYSMWVDFNNYEVSFPVSGPLNETSGCPYGYTCQSMVPCRDGDTCEAPPEILQMIDLANTGFCLRYTVS